ncbi:hypothetical protein KA005_35835, partial [bacterium]|nr:hypothetical protein [bacterium]
HLQTKIDRLRELSDYIEILEQLPPRVVAQLKTANEIIRRARYKNYERYEQPLLTEKEKGG